MVVHPKSMREPVKQTHFSCCKLLFSDGSLAWPDRTFSILSKTNVKPVIKQPVGATLVLDTHTFDDVVMVSACSQAGFAAAE